MFYNRVQECVNSLFLQNLHIWCKTRLKYRNSMDILAVFKTLNFI